MADLKAPPRPLKTAAVIAVGSELLGSTRLDTNSLYLADVLGSLGIELHHKTVVGDDRTDLAAAFRYAWATADLVVLTGGLGPTDDDLTREVVAEVLGRPLALDEGVAEAIRARFARRGMRMPAVNLRQAQVPDGAVVLDNRNGTAPGLLLEQDGRLAILLPGPPRELKPMVESLVAGPLGARAGAERLFTAHVLTTGLPESTVEEIVQPLYSPWRDESPPIATTILASPGQVELHLTIRSVDTDAARGRLRQARAELEAALGDAVFSTELRTLEQVVGQQLQRNGHTVAVAESCTGGLLLSRLTDVPGSSAYVLGGVVAYSDDAKTGLVRVDQAIIRAHGAVSEPVAVALAEGARERFGASVAAGVTGIAGPGGGTPEKPVGTVAIAVIGPSGAAQVRTFRFIGDRAMIKTQASQAALNMLRLMLAVGSRQ